MAFLRRHRAWYHPLLSSSVQAETRLTEERGWLDEEGRKQIHNGILRRARWVKNPNRCVMVQRPWLRSREASSRKRRSPRDPHADCLALAAIETQQSCQTRTWPPQVAAGVSSQELCSNCLCPSSSPDTTSEPLIFFQGAESMPRTSCSLWVMVSEHRTSPRERRVAEPQSPRGYLPKGALPQKHPGKALLGMLG